MSSDLLKEKQTDSGWRSPREQAPSEMRADEPLLPQIVGMIGLMLLVLGAVALLVRAGGRSPFIGQGMAILSVVAGLAAMLFHAALDKEQQVRRLYGMFGLLLLAGGLLVSLVPLKEQPAGALFFPYGVCALSVGLFFAIAFLHNETEERLHTYYSSLVGLLGAALALVGLIGSTVSANFLLGPPGNEFRPLGLLLSLLGLFKLAAFVEVKGPGSDLGYRTGQFMGLLGVVTFLIALGRSALPPLLYSWGVLSTRPEPYLVPEGFLLMVLGALYALLAAGLVSDQLVVVMTRRELSAFFYSPIAYIVLFVVVVLAWVAYLLFLPIVLPGRGMPPTEPVIQYYIIAWWPILTVLVAVPLLTMGQLSEERRTGTLEVLLTAPLNEWSVILSKFLAVLIFFLIICLPYGLFLLALRIQGGQPFDYRPLLSFLIAMTATGAAFLSLGLFFSSLTRNQIASAILTFSVLVGWLAIFFFRMDDPVAGDSAWRNFLQYISFIDFWMDSVRGTLSPRFLIFYGSVAAFWLFLTHKVLEARKWS